MASHTLKIWPIYFNAILDGRKKAEYRVNDRDFVAGDILVLKEYDPRERVFTGRGLRTEITHLFIVGTHAVLSIDYLPGNGQTFID